VDAAGVEASVDGAGDGGSGLTANLRPAEQPFTTTAKAAQRDCRNDFRCRDPSCRGAGHFTRGCAFGELALFRAERGRYELVPCVQGYIKYLKDRATFSASSSQLSPSGWRWRASRTLVREPLKHSSTKRSLDAPPDRHRRFASSRQSVTAPPSGPQSRRHARRVDAGLTPHRPRGLIHGPRLSARLSAI
jgi:hypothetical protein